jgi:hypothetical protein
MGIFLLLMAAPTTLIGTELRDFGIKNIPKSPGKNMKGKRTKKFLKRI